jgi:quinolinate synthase
VDSIPREQQIIFVPDQSLGDYVRRKLNRDMILWQGYCPTHHRILKSQIDALREEYPHAEVVVHPECTADVVDAADHVDSTAGMLRYCRESDAEVFVIGTEEGLLHRLKKENPAKKFIHLSPFADCPNMKLITIEKVLWSLEDMAYPVTVPEPTASQARRAIERMLELS